MNYTTAIREAWDQVRAAGDDLPAEIKIRAFEIVLDQLVRTDGPKPNEVLAPTNVETGEIIPVRSEREVFEIVGLTYLPPEER